MKKISRQSLHIVFFLIAALMCLTPWATTIGASFGDAAGDTGTGQVQVDLNVNNEAIQDVLFNLYRVGTIDTTTGVFGLADSFSTVHVDLNALKTTDEATKAAYKFLAAAEQNQIPPIRYGNTDSNGRLLFRDLPDGIYVLGKGSGSERVIVQPSLFPIPASYAAPVDGINVTTSVDSVTSITENAEGGNFVDVYPKAEVIPEGKEEKKCSISVTKRFEKSDEEAQELIRLFTEFNDHIKVQLFHDEDGEAPASEKKSLVIVQDTSSTVTFDNLDPGTYYVREFYDDVMVSDDPAAENLDANGWPFACFISADGGYTNEVTVRLTGGEDEAHGEFTVENIYYSPDIPPEFYLSGRIYIKKNVFDADGNVTTTDDKFYAAVSNATKESDGTLKDNPDDFFKVIELKQNETVYMDVPINPNGTTYFHVYEVTDETGAVKVTDSNTFTDTWFVGYSDGTEDAALVEMNYEGTTPISNVTIDNKLKPEPSVTPTGTPTPTPTPTPGPEASNTPTPAATTTPQPTPPGSPRITNPPGSTTSTNVAQTQGSVSESTPPIKTGDDTPIALYVILLACAAAVVIILVVRKKRK